MATATQLTSCAMIEIVGVELAEAESTMMVDVLGVCARHLHYAKTIIVTCNERVPADAEPYKNPGWLEWSIRVMRKDGAQGLYIGAIQRTPGAATEFHT